MLGTIAGLTEQLARRSLPPDVVSWASPVPYFGKIARARVATVGINPSNLEFVDATGSPLVGSRRRLETLDSLRLSAWRDADGETVRTVARSCAMYFRLNPYRRWFDVLERVLAMGGHSYYSGNLAAHIDLVPYTTGTKWGELSPRVRRALIADGRLPLAELIASSSVDLLVLNGRSVVDAFVASTASALAVTAVDELNLPRSGGKWVQGLRWDGVVTHIAGYDLGREVRVVGFNHNLQSSFGVTRHVIERIGVAVGDLSA